MAHYSEQRNEYWWITINCSIQELFHERHFSVLESSPGFHIAFSNHISLVSSGLESSFVFIFSYLISFEEL